MQWGDYRLKKLLNILFIILILSLVFAGCSKSNEEERSKLKEKIRAEVEAEMKENKENEVTKLSQEELKSSMVDYETKLHEFLDNSPGGFYHEDIKQFELYKTNEEFKKYVDKLLVLGYGIEQGEGYYYLYVGEPQGQENDTGNSATPSTSKQNVSTSSNKALIEKIGSDFYKFKLNSTVYFDINEDGKDEEIRYEIVDEFNGKLTIKGYDPIELYLEAPESDYFVIVKFKDKFDTAMNMIGIIDYGPSMDPITELYSIIAPQGENAFVNVGSIPGFLVHSSEYNQSNEEDFDYKAILLDNKGIEAPVRLDILGTWFGRNLFTYYSTYCSLIDNIHKYNSDYKTRIVLDAKNSVATYKEKDLGSKNGTINGGQKVTLTTTDNKEWVYMKADDGNEGWVNIKDITNTNFSEFPAYD